MCVCGRAKGGGGEMRGRESRKLANTKSIRIEKSTGTGLRFCQFVLRLGYKSTVFRKPPTKMKSRCKKVKYFLPSQIYRGYSVGGGEDREKG